MLRTATLTTDTARQAPRALEEPKRPLTLPHLQSATWMLYSYALAEFTNHTSLLRFYLLIYIFGLQDYALLISGMSLPYCAIELPPCFITHYANTEVCN